MRNHFVPEFYFKPWLNEKGELREFSWNRKGLSAKWRTPGQICYEKDLHTFDGEFEPKQRDGIEAWLTKEIDDKAAPVVAKIILSGLASLKSAEASCIARFVQSLLIRNPKSVEYMKRETPSRLAANLGRSDELLSKMFEGRMPSGLPSLVDYFKDRYPGMIENAGKVLIMDIVADSKATKQLLDMEWWVEDYTETSVYPQITSDRPVICEGIGLDKPDAFAILPLSPRFVLYMAPKAMQTELYGLGKGWAGLHVMRGVLEGATRKAFGTDRTNLAFVKKHLIRPTSSKLDPE